MILSVDIGTTAIKASALDHEGVEHAASSRRSEIIHTGDGRFEQSLDEIMRSVAEVVHEVLVGLDQVPAAIALTGQGDGLWLRRADGSAVGNGISWLDSRASSILEAWQRNGTLDAVFRSTGSAMFPASHGPLLAWFSQHDPGALGEAAVAGYCVDAVIHQLCGEITVSASDASMPFLNVLTRKYNYDAIEACGLLELADLLPMPAADDAVFYLTNSGSALLGLPVGFPVINGQYDVVTSALGLGAREEQDAVVVLGTTLACQVVSRLAPPPQADEEPAGMWLCTPLQSGWLRVMPSMVGTASIDWVLRLIGAPVAKLDQLLLESPDGAAGVRAFSFFGTGGERAPFVEPKARARFVNLSIDNSPADLVRATAESVAFAARHCLERAGAGPTIAVGGGGSQSKPWLQIMANVLGREVSTIAHFSAGNRGAAMAAWAALGSPVDHVHWTRTAETFQPDPNVSAGYEDRFGMYLSEVEDAREEWLTSR